MEYDRGLPDASSPAVTEDQPLIGVLAEEDGRRVVRYSTNDDVPANGDAADARLSAALSVIGAWSDLDWEDFSAELDRIRHESRPTPPIAL